MPKKYSTEEFWKLYKNLPRKIKDLLFEEEVGLNVSKVCRRNEVEGNFDQIMDWVTEVLLGLLSPEEFKKSLEKDLVLREKNPEKIYREINRFIFFPVKEELNSLYEIEVVLPSGEKISGNKLSQDKKEKEDDRKNKDTYREPIE